MNIKKFTGKSSREVIRLLKDTLGPEAVILSNRQVDGKVEILAVASEDMASLAPPAREGEAAARHLPRPVYRHVKKNPKETRKAAPDAPAQNVKMLPAAQKVVERPVKAAAADEKPAPKKVAETPKEATDNGLKKVVTEIRSMRDMFETQVTEASKKAVDNGLKKIRTEMRSMQNMFETQLAEITWSSRQHREPARAALLREMLDVGFSASMARYVIDHVPEADNVEKGLRWIQSALACNLHVAENEDEFLKKGGVFALVGPTGVGKTTTTAKLAARCVMAHGAGKLALITTDGYRIGGFEQLRIYGKIMGVMVHSVKDAADLRLALDELKSKHIVLIDTVGVSQRDKMVVEQAAMLANAGTEIKRLLCLSATSTGETLNDVVRAYKGDGLAGCIMTKVDEAVTIGNLLDVVIRQKMKLFYLANGQRVPEDLHMVNPQVLIEQAFKLKRDKNVFQFHDEELPVVMAGTAKGYAVRGVVNG